MYLNKLKHSLLFKDSLWSLIGSVFGQGLGLVAGIVVARFLGKDIYGEYGMIKTTLINIAIFSTFGLGYTATKFIAESKNNNKQSIRQIVTGSINITFAISVLFSLFLFIFARQVAIYLNAEHLALSLRIFAVIIIFNALTTVQVGILAGFNEFKAVAINKTIVGIITFVLSVVLTYFWNIEGALLALLIAIAANCVLNNMVVRKQLKKYPHRKNVSFAMIKKLFSFSVPVALNEGLNSLAILLISALLIKLSNYGEVGLYSIAMQWSSIILFIPGVLRNVTLSHLAGTYSEIKQHNKVFKRMIAVNFISTFIIFCVVYFFSELIVSVYGESFLSLKYVLNISVFTTIFNSVSSVYVQEYIVKNMNWRLFCIALIRYIGIIILAYIFLINYQSERYSGSYLVLLSSLIMCIVALILFHIILKIRTNK